MYSTSRLLVLCLVLLQLSFIQNSTKQESTYSNINDQNIKDIWFLFRTALNWYFILIYMYQVGKIILSLYKIATRLYKLETPLYKLCVLRAVKFLRISMLILAFLFILINSYDF